VIEFACTCKRVGGASFPLPIVSLSRDPQPCWGTSFIRNGTPPQDHHKALGIDLLQGPREALLLMSEVLPYMAAVLQVRKVSLS